MPPVDGCSCRCGTSVGSRIRCSSTGPLRWRRAPSLRRAMSAWCARRLRMSFLERSSAPRFWRSSKPFVAVPGTHSWPASTVSSCTGRTATSSTSSCRTTPTIGSTSTAGRSRIARDCCWRSSTSSCPSGGRAGSACISLRAVMCMTWATRTGRTPSATSRPNSAAVALPSSALVSASVKTASVRGSGPHSAAATS